LQSEFLLHYESSGHGAYFDRGAVVAAVGAVSLVAPALAVGGVALVGKMAAGSAMKTLDGIATDSSSKVVKQISSDLAKDVVVPKMLSDNPASTHTEVTVDAKAVTTANEGGATIKLICRLQQSTILLKLRQRLLLPPRQKLQWQLQKLSPQTKCPSRRMRLKACPIPLLGILWIRNLILP
jgi:hypothetical protein